MDFLLFFLPLSVAGNVALILTVIGDNVELDEHGVRRVGDKERLGLQGKCNDFIDDGGK